MERCMLRYGLRNDAMPGDNSDVGAWERDVAGGIGFSRERSLLWVGNLNPNQTAFHVNEPACTTAKERYREDHLHDG